MLMKNTFTYAMAAVCSAMFLLSGCRESAGIQETSCTESDGEMQVAEYGIPVSGLRKEEGKVMRGDYFAKIMNRLGVSYGEAYSLSEVCSEVFDPRKIKVGNPYVAYFRGDSLAYWRYDADSRNYLVLSLMDSVSAHMYGKELVTETRYSEITVENSLWYDVQQAGVPVQLALEISDVYQWTVDMFGLQRGDSFKVLYDVVSFEGEVLYIDRIRYCIFSFGGHDNFAYWFDQGDGSSNRYWNEDGESLRKAFLKAPLKFTRISSKFTYSRKHPITRVVRPHTGVDYAAPAGTPVQAIGDGVVTMRKYSGGGGNTVKIRHNSVYTSAYLHLSGYGPGIKVGSKVKQGQVIGYVGSTGMSTGPHLDFRIWKNGTPINPLTMESPSVEPVSKDRMDAFKAQVGIYRRHQDSIVASGFVNEYVGMLCRRSAH